MSGGNILPHHLLDLKGFQFSNEPRSDDETDEKTGQNGIDGSEGDIPKDIEEGEIFVKGIEEMIKHPFKPSFPSGLQRFFPCPFSWNL
jgi:hypothetical protein